VSATPRRSHVELVRAVSRRVPGISIELDVKGNKCPQLQYAVIW
jgi:hypothetical protein